MTEIWNILSIHIPSRDPKRFKGMAFTLEERQTLGIHGLLPARIKTLDEQVWWTLDQPFLNVWSQAENCMRNLRRYTDPLNQYMYLVIIHCDGPGVGCWALSPSVQSSRWTCWTGTRSSSTSCCQRTRWSWCQSSTLPPSVSPARSLASPSSDPRLS